MKIIWKIDRKPVLLRDEFKRTSAFLLGLKEFRRAAVLGCGYTPPCCTCGQFRYSKMIGDALGTGYSGGPVSGKVENLFFIICLL